MKPLRVAAYELGEVTLPEDRELLALLLRSDAAAESRYSAYRYYTIDGYSPSRAVIRLAHEMHDVLLPRLGACRRFVWVSNSNEAPDVHGRPLVWDDGPAWRFRLKIEADDARQCWNLTGQLHRGDQVVRLCDPVLLQARGLVLFQDTLARLATGQEFPWISLLRHVEVIPVSYQERGDLLQRLWQLPTVPEVDLPENLRLQRVRVEPRGHLRVHPMPEGRKLNKLRADVSFLYGDQVVSSGSRQTSVLDLQNDCVVERDELREQELMAQLSAAGVQLAARYRPGLPGALELSRRQMPEIVEQLVQARWLVEAEGRRVRRAGSCSLSVRSTVDWFELDGQFDFEGISAKLPELLAALRRGEKYVLLDDGSHGMLPEEWMKRYGALADLGKSQGESVRFVPSQAALLDALLAAQQQNVQVDATFDQLRTKLRSFEGVQPRTEPSTFSGCLRHYQRDGLGWLHFLQEFHLGGCLADDMGLGKTVQVLALLDEHRQRPAAAPQGGGPSLVVVPRSLVFNWIEEATRFTPNLRVLNYTGLDRGGSLEHLDAYDVMVTTYGTLRRDIPQLKDITFDYAILDEAQAIKNAQSQAAKACRLIHARHRLAMTGTPVENHLGELWSLFEFLNPGMLGRSTAFQKFQRRAMAHPLTERPIETAAAGPHDGHPRPAADTSADPHWVGGLSLLASALRPFILRRTKQRVLTELPEKTEQTLYCEMQTKQRRLYVQLRDYYRASLAKRIEDSGMEKAKIHVLEALFRLHRWPATQGCWMPKRWTTRAPSWRRCWRRWPRSRTKATRPWSSRNSPAC